MLSHLGELVLLIPEDPSAFCSAELDEHPPVHPELVSQEGQLGLLPALKPQVLKHSQAGLDPASTPALFGVVETRSMT